MPPTTLYSGAVLQSGLAQPALSRGQANGLLLRGVVTAVYRTDDAQHPYNTPQTIPSAIYCDVLCYSLAGGTQAIFMPKVLLSLEAANGPQAGDIWVPRAATLDVSQAPLQVDAASVMRMDGSHVIVGFLGNSLTQPVILRSLPHPQSDIGQAAAEPAMGQRMRLTQVDGSVRLVKHNGSVYGVSAQGDIVLRTLYANQGELTPAGAPPPPPADSTVGNLLIELHSRSARLTTLLDMDTPATPTEVLREVLDATKWQIQFTQQVAHLLVGDAGGVTLEAKGSAAGATLAVGTGAKSVAIAEYLQAMWAQMVAVFNSHTHGSAFGPTGPTTAVGFQAPTWDGHINSTHVKIPDEAP